MSSKHSLNLDLSLESVKASTAPKRLGAFLAIGLALSSCAHREKGPTPCERVETPLCERMNAEQQLREDELELERINGKVETLKAKIESARLRIESMPRDTKKN